jgi:hypothetical protein
MRSIRIAVLNSHPIQYFAPFYAYLNAAPDLEITALYTGDTAALTESLRRLIEDDDLRRKQGEASRARIQSWSYRECLEGLRAAIADLKLRDAVGMSVISKGPA